MKIEIKEFYPFKRNPKGFTGQLRIRIDDAFDILGVQVEFRDSKYFFKAPFAQTYCPRAEEIVRYPLFTFVDRAKNRELMSYIFENGPDFILKRLKSKTNPLVWPDPKKLVKPKKGGNKKPSEQKGLKQARNYVDPPKRNYSGVRSREC